MKRTAFFPLLISALMSVVSSGAYANYCAAIRGNGELMPAHWGAMSSIVEEQGLPAAMAGGSSASITMFLLESISLNPLPQNNSEKALLIKSFQGYLEALSQTPEGKAIQSLLSDKSAFQSIIATSPKLDEALANPANKALLVKHLGSLQALMASEDLKEILNPEFILYVKRTLAMAKLQEDSLKPIVNYRVNQIKQAFKNFGKFDAKTDKTLFLRPGLINFASLGRILGKMADFYAGYNLQSATGKQVQQLVRNFLDLCTPESKNMTWAELNQQRPACRQLLGGAILMYREAKNSSQSRVNDLVGSHIPSFPTTSVLYGKAVEQFTQLYVDYQTNPDPNFGDFTVNPEELRFGYWGKPADLNAIENKIRTAAEYKDDAKSQKFLSLGQAPWLNVLSTSPAEPGLSHIVALSRTELSAGGWSDLHPVMVLKAYGCEKIIYLTRKGEESPFAQGVFQRLIKADEKTVEQFYGLENLNSSMMRSQANATQIKCTDWNHFDVRADMNGLVAEAMRAPLLDPPYCK
ncbi:MAG TPA: hypothetical protein VIG33_05615 [Pseudobdellovibrionaceae bacterium]|jgi:hypothetical protein